MQDRVLKIKEVFDEIYGDAVCTLDFDKPYELLIATQLAAQCTDARVNIVMKDLVKKYPTLEDFANADLNELMQDVYSTGFYRNKAKNIIATAQIILSDFGGEVPDNMDDLLKLPGTGRKTANLILGDVYGQPAIVVDTHAGRLSRRIGFTKHKDPYKVELDLKEIVPPSYQAKFCHQLVYHGREVCKSQRPICETCPINLLCDKKI